MYLNKYVKILLWYKDSNFYFGYLSNKNINKDSGHYV